MKKLKKSKPFGSIRPPHNGAVFFQDGCYFDASGAFLFADEGVDPNQDDTPETETQIVTTVDEDGTRTEEEIEVEVPEEEIEEDPKLVLSEWLCGTREVHHMTTGSLIKKAYGVIKRSQDEKIDFLVNEVQLVPAEDVRI